MLSEAAWYFEGEKNAPDRLDPRAEAMRDTVTKYSDYQGELYTPLAEKLNNTAILKARTGLEIADFEGKLCLDAGCGAGRMSRVMARGGGRVIALDAGFSVEAARAQSDPELGIEWIQGDLLRPPFRREIFQRIISIGVLHHTAEPDAGFQALTDLLAETGTFSLYLYMRPHQDWRRYGSPQALLGQLRYALLTEPLRKQISALPKGVRLNFCRLLWQRRRLVEKIRARGRLGEGFAKALDWVTLPDVYKPLENGQSNITRNFDMYSTPYNYHHELSEVIDWFEKDGRFAEVLITPYRLAMTGTRGPRPKGAALQIYYHRQRSMNSISAQGRESN